MGEAGSAAAGVMGDLIPYRSPREKSDTTAFLGMVLFLASWAMMFAALFFAYGMVRSRAEAWPPPEAPRLPLHLAGLATLLLGASSAALQGALASARRARPRAIAPAVGVAALLAIAFLATQLVTWSRLAGVGLVPSSGPFGSVLYAMSGFHALHVAVGVGALFVLFVRALRGAYSAPRHLGLRLWSLYWHFVGVVWLAIFVLCYVL